MIVRRALASLWLGLAVLVSGCTRQAPGPEECQAYAFALASMTLGPYLTPDIRAQIEEVTRQCLTKPYDRAVMECVLTTGRQEACLRAFEQRRELAR